MHVEKEKKKYELRDFDKVKKEKKNNKKETIERYIEIDKETDV